MRSARKVIVRADTITRKDIAPAANTITIMAEIIADITKKNTKMSIVPAERMSMAPSIAVATVKDIKKNIALAVNTTITTNIVTVMTEDMKKHNVHAEDMITAIIITEKVANVAQLRGMSI